MKQTKSKKKKRKKKKISNPLKTNKQIKKQINKVNIPYVWWFHNFYQGQYISTQPLQYGPAVIQVYFFSAE